MVDVKARRRAFSRGFRAEYLAALSLLLKGYRIQALRYRTRSGEIDIVARKGDLAVFVEVKARTRVEDAVSAVGSASQQRIRNASMVWLSRQADAHRISLRYDILAVAPWRWPVHHVDAF